MNDNRSAVLSFLPWHISWITIILALLTAGTFLAVSKPGELYGVPTGTSGGVRMMEYNSGSEAVPQAPANVPMRGGSDAYYYPTPYPTDVPVTDTREFLKVYYNASMLTRDVQGLTRRVETTVRGYDGRVDQESISQKYGSISFAVPQSKYDAFRTELEGLVWTKFLTVQIQSENVLPQKQSIEEQQKQADTTLADAKVAQQKLANIHASMVKSLQTQIDADAQELASLRAQAQTYDIQVQIQTVSDDWSSLKAQLANENSSYSTQLSYANDVIKSAQDWQKAVKTQDQALLDSVATVTGTVSIQWISLWDTALLYLPGYWIPAIFAVLTCLSFIRDRRRSMTL